MIHLADKNDFSALLAIINDAAVAYKPILPQVHWHEPYMPKEELSRQIAAGVRFYCLSDAEEIAGVMGFQDKAEVQLIRHAYVRSTHQGRGIGGTLLRYLIGQSDKPLLVGTWKKAVWAIGFYEKHGFVQVGDAESTRLLEKYWNIPQWHAETSLVLELR
jgi:GNAT superfamily N-acetyltransferase